MSIKLTLTAEQAQVVSKACEFYSRIKIGQFQEILWNTLDIQLPCDDFCSRRDLAEHFLLEARKYIYPNLHGIGHSYGIGKFEEADKSFDVYQVIRPHFDDPRSPFSFYPLPVCEKKEERKEGKWEISIVLILTKEQAKIVSKACEFYARIKAGQFKEVIELTLDNNLPITKYCEYRDKAEYFLLEARKYIYPKLSGSIDSSFCIRKFEDASVAFDVHQVVRHHLGDSRPPISPNPLPKIEKIEEEKKGKEK